jgi:uncharacterized protein (DUF697 family)/tellurite resistance protein
MFEIQTPVNPTSLQSPREFAIGRRGPRAHTFGMSTQPEPMGEVEQKAILAVCVLAAFADGAQSDVERARVGQVLQGFGEEGADLVPVYQEVLAGKLDLATAAGRLRTPSARALAYEMAVGVCHADGTLNEAEQIFLADLRPALQLDSVGAESHRQAAEAIVAQPLDGPVPGVSDANREGEIDRLILNASILNGALEILPHALATLAIIPLQMRMVYRIGNRYGYDLDRGHIKDFLGTVGVGLTSQVLEGYTRRLIGGFTRRLAGGLLGGLAGQTAGSAIAFATTYALGQAARRYYAGGRTLNAAQLKDMFASMLREGRSLQSRYSGNIADRARQVNVAELLPLARQL